VAGACVTRAVRRRGDFLTQTEGRPAFFRLFETPIRHY
jgi:hypothetical protein